MHAIPSPYLLFLGKETDFQNAKTASGILHWRPDFCGGQYRMPGCEVDLGIADLTIEQAVKAGIKTLVIGTAPAGGAVDEGWVSVLSGALEAGLDLAAGLHQRLVDIPALAEAAQKHGRQLFDVRQPDQDFTVGSGQPRTGKRLLTVGTDCAVGKMFTSLALMREMQARGMEADFRATGQTGIFIAGGGVCIDAVVADFISGAAESLSPNNRADHWDLIEGQGSLFHPSYAGVTLGLLHGSQPDFLVLCHDASRTDICDVEGFAVPDLRDCMASYLSAARLTNPKAAFVGIAVNTSSLDDKTASAYLENTSREFGLPCCDPVRTGLSAIVDVLETL